MRQGPLAGRYPAVAAMVLLALIPYLALSAALEPLTPIIGEQFGAGPQALALSSGLANAAYAVGTVLAVQLAQHLPQRRVMIVYVVLLVLACIVTASAQSIVMFDIGRIVQGLCTSLLLIAAVPPLALGYPIDKLKTTAVIMSMCIFGAVAAGPAIGGLQAQADAWRPLFWIVAGVAAIALALALLTFEDAPPADPASPVDAPAIGLAGIGCLAAFFGSSMLATHAFLDPIAIVPLVGGLAVIVTLIVYQATAKNPLLTIRSMLTSSIPVAGIVLALLAATASVSATALTAEAMAGEYTPLHLGLLYLPELGGAFLTAIILGQVMPTRLLQWMPLVGMGFLAVGILLFRIQVPASEGMTLVASFITGIGLGATVAPALFVSGFALRATNLQRVFAIVELLRAVAAFMIAPIFAHFAVNVSGGLNHGVGIALWIGFALAILGGIVPVLIYLGSGARPKTPNLELFLAGEGPAYPSPPLLARLRSGVGSESGQAVTEGVD
ncbi:MAG TPA: MFS transporter [Solirubrobacterales bacterium]|nr:MFS transporter [Solirubrobacterales bacterium]